MKSQQPAASLHKALSIQGSVTPKQLIHWQTIEDLAKLGSRVLQDPPDSISAVTYNDETISTFHRDQPANASCAILTAITEGIMDTLTLSQADTRRLEKLAHEAGRTPGEVLKHVLRDGFEATESAIKTVKARMRSNERVPHEEAMQQLDNLIEHHVRNEKQAA